MSRRIIVITILTLIVFIGILVFLNLVGRYRIVSDEGYAMPITRTKNTFKHLFLCMHTMIIEEGYEHPIDMEMIKEYAQKNDFRSVTTKMYNNEICDEWKNPIVLFFEKPLKYTFVSYGPNKRYDQGAGDDIVEIIDGSSETGRENETENRE